MLEAEPEARRPEAGVYSPRATIRPLADHASQWGLLAFKRPCGAFSFSLRLHGLNLWFVAVGAEELAKELVVCFQAVGLALHYFKPPGNFAKVLHHGRYREAHNHAGQTGNEQAVCCRSVSTTKANNEADDRQKPIHAAKKPKRRCHARISAFNYVCHAADNAVSAVV